MAINVFRPSTLGFNSYGWKGSSLYNSADAPSLWVRGASQQDRVIIEQQMAYEWLNSGEGVNASGTQLWSTNPPFLSGAAGRLLPGLEAPASQGGKSPRILRGFIRRAESDLSDPVAMSRLYFMFNPEMITRDYVSYLDQGALDPFNTVFQSGNLVAPPSYMDFTFSLLFDRQEEATDPTHPGVFVDYQYFDLVVRNVIPASDPNSMNATLPDNGVMMVNPRDITVIFSPQITIQGRPSNARVSFQKFTHRMVPTRMQIDLTVRVVYFGPMKDMNPYVKETETTAATVDLGTYVDPFNISPADMVRYKAEWQTQLSGAANTTTTVSPDAPPYTDPVAPIILGPSTTTYPAGITPLAIAISESSINVNKDIMAKAHAQVLAMGTKYVYAKSKDWSELDCSGMVYLAFKQLNQLSPMNWTGYGTSGVNSTTMYQAYKAKLDQRPDVNDMAEIWICDAGANEAERKRTVDAKSSNLAPGDLLWTMNVAGRHDHIAFFYCWDDPTVTGPSGKPNIFDAAGPDAVPQVGVHPIAYTDLYNFSDALRPITAP